MIIYHYNSIAINNVACLFMLINPNSFMCFTDVVVHIHGQQVKSDFCLSFYHILYIVVSLKQVLKKKKHTNMSD